MGSPGRSAATLQPANFALLNPKERRGATQDGPRGPDPALCSLSGPGDPAERAIATGIALTL